MMHCCALAGTDGWALPFWGGKGKREKPKKTNGGGDTSRIRTPCPIPGNEKSNQRFVGVKMTTQSWAWTFFWGKKLFAKKVKFLRNRKFKLN